MEFARDTLASRDKGGMETEGEGFLDLNFCENDGILELILDAKPLSGDASGRCRFALGFLGYSLSI